MGGKKSKENLEDPESQLTEEEILEAGKNLKFMGQVSEFRVTFPEIELLTEPGDAFGNVLPRCDETGFHASCYGIDGKISEIWYIADFCWGGQKRVPEVKTFFGTDREPSILCSTSSDVFLEMAENDGALSLIKMDMERAKTVIPKSVYQMQPVYHTDHALLKFNNDFGLGSYYIDVFEAFGKDFDTYAEVDFTQVCIYDVAVKAAELKKIAGNAKDVQKIMKVGVKELKKQLEKKAKDKLKEVVEEKVDEWVADLQDSFPDIVEEGTPDEEALPAVFESLKKFYESAKIFGCVDVPNYRGDTREAIYQVTMKFDGEFQSYATYTTLTLGSMMTYAVAALL